MALDAVILHDPRDLVAVGHFAGFSAALEHAADQAAAGIGTGNAHVFAGQQFFQRVGQIRVVDFKLRIPAAGLNAVLIVDAPGVANLAIGIEHEHLRIAPGAHLVGQQIVEIFQEREFDLVRLGVLRHFGDRVLPIGIDSHEGHALGLVGFGHLGQPRAIQLAKRTLNAHERNHDELRVFQIGQRMGLAAKVL